MNNFIVDTTDTYYLNKIYSDIDMLTIKYKHILSKEIIGKSVEGRDLIALRLSSSDRNEKPSVLFTGGIHAREDFSVMLCMKMMDYYCYHYSENNRLSYYNVKKNNR